MQAQTSSRISSATRSDRKTASRRRGSGGCSSPTKGSRTAARPPCGPTPRVTAPMAPAGPSTSTRLATSPRRLGGTRLQSMCTSSLLWGRPARGQRGPETADWPRLAHRSSGQLRARSDARQEQPPTSYSLRGANCSLAEPSASLLSTCRSSRASSRASSRQSQVLSIDVVLVVYWQWAGYLSYRYCLYCLL